MQGRGNAGISPLAGIIVGSPEQHVDVKVNVVPRAREARFRCITI
ncbi:MAG TPA: hypothetical protein VHT48_07265 [Methylocella sp.]|nr:hypothetical protein [Methylocella sp.]